jgi:aspartyl-tRNA(Asn)/glutamyl-tRNA(Gln) amidotransferase subunit B
VSATVVTENYQTTIGLEVHVELSTESKMFCGCKVAFAGEPNTRTCPVCLGLPGALPVPNQKAIEYTIKIGRALKCEIPSYSLFHRKNYFYPDMPKNYQISQFDLPLCCGGVVGIFGDFGHHKVGVTRVHLEEDTGKSMHVGGSGRIGDSAYSLEDFNRAGTPLVEIVGDPDIHSAEQARAYITELRAIIESLGVSDVRMEEGSMRVDANISVRAAGEIEHGTKVEVKNMNSIRSVARALAYEEERQRRLLDRGELVVQETRHFDERSGKTLPGRTKEVSSDYRYFPEPDLVPFELSPEWIRQIDASLPELPAQRRTRFVSEYGLSEKEAEILTVSRGTGDWFEKAAKAYGGEAKKVANWVLADLYGLLNEAGAELQEARVAPEQLAGLVKLIDTGAISGKQGKAVLQEMFETGDDPQAIAERRGLRQITDSAAIESVVDEVIGENSEAAERVRSGNLGTIGFLVGQVMKKTSGQANPQLVNELLKRKLTS